MTPAVFKTIRRHGTKLVINEEQDGIVCIKPDFECLGYTFQALEAIQNYDKVFAALAELLDSLHNQGSRSSDIDFLSKIDIAEGLIELIEETRHE